MLQGRRIDIRGTVQGVGFRPWVWQLATRESVVGRVWNDATGVVIEAFAAGEVLDRFIDCLTTDAPPAARIRELEWHAIPAECDAPDFRIAESEASSQRGVAVPPDLSTCDDCLAEVFDPLDRRFRYPFINCTNCGPRFSIVQGVPYDRARTSMATFVMCDDCRREYEDPANRRFHAQPNACRKCGPRLWAADANGREIDAADVFRFAARVLRDQMIVAVKGLGGFHLACDATSSYAVRRLRERKQREAKPLAIMVRDLAAAERIAQVSEAERALLTSAERPIVLLRRHDDAAIAAEVSGDNPLIGVFLPYTPLHHILLREIGRPLVMTSGNVSDEPMAYRNRYAVATLGNIADIFLLHNREIESRIDDSVARVIDDATVVFRRARGWVPRGIEMALPFSEPILACGAHLKNAVCIGAGNSAFLGPHIGDLETVETFRAFEESVTRMKSFIGVEPRLLAHDLHPDYLSTRYALAQDGVRTVAVQHHHAHVVSVMGEHHLTEPVVGLAYDGTGYGPDGTSWGAEVMVASYEGFERFSTFRPLSLPGGDRAIHQVWRIALGLLDEAFDGAPPLDRLPLFAPSGRTAEAAASTQSLLTHEHIVPASIESIRRMITQGVNTPLARGIGRYFDAFGATFLGRTEARYEGEVAFLWNVIADEHERGRYEVVIHEGTEPWEVDFRPVMKAAVDDFLAGRSVATISARFHNTLVDVSAELVRAALTQIGDVAVVLSGGCFQNARLAEGIKGSLRHAHRVYMNHDIPPGDGGLAFGQALVAGAFARGTARTTDSELQTTGVFTCV